jgi:signal transduction histidine kinase
VPAVAGFSLLARSTYLRERDDAKQDVERVAQSVNSLVEREIDNRMVLAKTLGVSRALADADLRKFYQEALQATQGSGSWVVLLDPAQQLFNTLVPFEERRLYPRPAGGSFVLDAPRISLVMRAPSSQEPALAVVAAASDSKPPKYNVAVAFSPDVVQSLIEQQKLPDTLISVLNDQHEIVGRSREPEKWIGKKAGQGIQRLAQGNQAGFTETVTLDGVPSLTYLSPANRYGWNVVMALPNSALTRSAQRLSFQALAASGFLLFIGLFIAVVVSRRIAAPVVSLSEAAAQLGRDQVPKALTTGIFEVNEVSRTLEVAGQRSQEATRTLESKVAKAVEEARLAQAALHEGQKLEAIGRLTGGFAHDFNNLLQTIISAQHVLSRHIAEDAPHRRFLDAATRASTKAADLVRQMMSFGRAEPHKPVPVDLRQHVLLSHELTRKAVGERIQLSAVFADDLPALFVDPAQLELALLNLLFNARDAMPDGGAITMAARLARPDETEGLEARPYVCLDIRDSGTGMDEATRARAFEPYFTTKPVGAGTGLGLAQVMSFIRQSQGNILLDSSVGSGTTVRLILPTTDKRPAAGGEPKYPTSTTSRRLRICMVEDDSLVSSVVLPVLRDAGHEVTCSDTADAAQALLSSGAQFDVLFTDVVMPGRMTGLDLVAWCKTHAPNMVAIVATGYAGQQPRDDLIELRKPYRLDELLACLQHATEPRATS